MLVLFVKGAVVFNTKLVILGKNRIPNCRVGLITTDRFSDDIIGTVVLSLLGEIMLLSDAGGVLLASGAELSLTGRFGFGVLFSGGESPAEAFSPLGSLSSIGRMPISLLLSSSGKMPITAPVRE